MARRGKPHKHGKRVGAASEVGYGGAGGRTGKRSGTEAGAGGSGRAPRTGSGTGSGGSRPGYRGKSSEAGSGSGRKPASKPAPKATPQKTTTAKKAPNLGQGNLKKVASPSGKRAPKTLSGILAMIRSDKSLSASTKKAMIKSVRQKRGGSHGEG